MGIANFNTLQLHKQTFPRLDGKEM